MSTTSFIRSVLSRTEASTACSASRLWGGTFTRGGSAAPCDVSLEPLIVPPFPGRWPLFRHHLDRDLGDHLRPRLDLHLVLPDLLDLLRAAPDAPAVVLEHVEVSHVGQNRQPLRDEVVASEPVGDLHDVAGLPEGFDVLAQDHFHRVPPP